MGLLNKTLPWLTLYLEFEPLKKVIISDFCPIFSGSNDWQWSCCDPGPWGHQLAGFQWGSQCRSHWIPPTAQYVGTNSKDSQKPVPAGRSKFTNDSNDTYRRNRKQWRSVFQSEPPSNTIYGWSMKKERKKKTNKKIEKKNWKEKERAWKKAFLKNCFCNSNCDSFLYLCTCNTTTSPYAPMPPYTCPPISRLFLKRPPWPPLSPLPKGMLI